MRQPVHDKLTLPKARTALLLIDLQEEQRVDPNYRAHDIEIVLSNVNRLLETARSKLWSVAHAQYVRDFNVEAPRPFEALSADGLATFSNAGSDLIQFCHEVAPKNSEPVFVKNDASAFKGTQLNSWLSEIKTEWLIVCGVWTDACIAATVRDAIDFGFRTLLVKDACGSGTQTMHETAVLNLANRLYGGGICDTARALTMLEGNSVDVWRVADPVPIRFTEENISEHYARL